MITKRFHERNKTTIGLVGIAVTAAVLAVALNSGAIYRGLTSTSYSALFPEAGGLLVGDEVRIGGLTVGKVGDVDLDLGRQLVKIDFSVTSPAPIGDATRAEIKTLTPLGKKFLAIEPRGMGELEPGTEIPPDRTNSPYDVAQALSALSNTTGQLDTRRFADSLDTLSDTFAETPPAVATALSGVKRLSSTIAGRDEALRTLLANTNSLTGVLNRRSDQIELLINDGNLLLTELYGRRDAIRALLVNTTQVVQQLRGVVDDNQTVIGPALDGMEKVLDLLKSNEQQINQAIPGLRGYARTLGEAVGGGPFFYAYIGNLVPTNLAPIIPELLQQRHGPSTGAPAPSAPPSPRGGN